MKVPSLDHRMSLPLKAVHIQCLDEAGQEIRNAVASGFICKENETYFLYTCWHVVTGYNLYDVKINGALPNRCSLRVSCQAGSSTSLMNDVDERIGEVRFIGGAQKFTVELYHSRKTPFKPAWYQSPTDNPNIDLNNVGIRVPLLSDIVKIPLPPDLVFESVQVIEVPEDPWVAAAPTDQVFIVGFPYGYSVAGLGQPTAVVIVRHLAALIAKDRGVESLLDGAAAPGMSGGPVFVNYEGEFKIAGIYTGLIYPDHIMQRSERVTALGTFCQLALSWTSQTLQPYE